ncbi:MAG TPA: hypothetical protein VGK61_02865 [Planctomycetota bacterium]|jgi:hypothetical protein
MKFRFGRAAVLALLFLGAQFASGLHVALEAGHDLHSCCADGGTAAHFDRCTFDHHAPPCAVCVAAHAPATVIPVASIQHLGETSMPESAPFAEILVDPTLLSVPDTRGPPA